MGDHKKSQEVVTLQTVLHQIQANHETTSTSISALTNEVNAMSLKVSSTSTTVENMQKQVNTLIGTVAEHDESINKFSSTQDNFGHRIAILEGLVQKQALRIAQLEQKQVYSVARSMQNNVMFFNIPENEHENARDVLETFLKDDMKVSDDDIPKIEIRKVHRTGNKLPDKPRKLVAQVGRPDIIFKHRSNLDFTKHQVAQQFPIEISEIRNDLKFVMKNELKNVSADDKKLVVDELYVGKEKYQPNFMRKHNAPVQYNPDSVNFQQDVPRITVSSEIQDKGNVFIGYSAEIKDLECARLILDAIAAMQRLSPPTHLPYAYFLSNQSNIQYQHDDGEAGAGSVIRQVLRDSATKHRIVGVARWFSGVKLGQKRLREMYRQAARDVLKKVFGPDWKPIAEPTANDWS